MNEHLFKFGSKSLNPLLVLRMYSNHGYRGSNRGRIKRHPKTRVPHYSGHYAYGSHHPYYKKIFDRQPWCVRWFRLPDPHIARWNEPEVIVVGADHKTLATLQCESNEHAKKVLFESFEKWTKALEKYTNVNK